MNNITKCYRKIDRIQSCTGMVLGSVFSIPALGFVQRKVYSQSLRPIFEQHLLVSVKSGPGHCWMSSQSCPGTCPGSRSKRYSTFMKLYSAFRISILLACPLLSGGISVGSDPNVPPGGTLAPTRCFRKGDTWPNQRNQTWIVCCVLSRQWGWMIIW